LEYGAGLRIGSEQLRGREIATRQWGGEWSIRSPTRKKGKLGGEGGRTRARPIKKSAFHLSRKGTKGMYALRESTRA